MMTGELLRMIAQLGGSVQQRPSGALVLAGLFGHPLRDKLVRVLKLHWHKSEIARRLAQPPFTNEEIEAKLDLEIADEPRLDLFGPGDGEWEHVKELHDAVMEVQKENDAVDALSASSVFEAVVTNHALAMSKPATAEAKDRPIDSPHDTQPNGISVVCQAGEVPAGLGSAATAAKRKTRHADRVAQSDRPTHSGSNATPVVPGPWLDASATGIPGHEHQG